MKQLMQNENSGIVGLFISWYTAFTALATIEKLPIFLSCAASIMTFIYYYRKNKKL